MQEFQVGDWRVCPDGNEIVRRSEHVRLEPRVMDLLVYLAERSGEVLSGDDILRDVWPYRSVSDSALLTAISSLRKALGDNSRQPVYIRTVPKRGYCLLAPSTARRAALAVLPIRNLSGNPDDEYFADGITELLISELGKIPAMRVISRQTVMAFKTSVQPLREIASRIGAGMLLEGGVILHGSRVNLSMQLIDARTDQQIWTHTSELSLDDVLSTQRRIAGTIAAEISQRLQPATDADERGASLPADALVDYLRGRFHWNKLSPAHFDTARQYFEQALEKEANFAPAQAGLADIFGAYCYWGLMPPTEARGLIDDAVSRAERMDDHCAEAKMLRGAYLFYFERNWQEAEDQFRRAIDLNPNLGHARMQHALFLGTLRRPNAHDESAMAVRLDPLNPVALLVQALCFARGARWNEALACLRNILDLEPDHPPALQLHADIAWLHDPVQAIELERGAWAVDPTIRAIIEDGPASDPRRCMDAAATHLIERSAGQFVQPIQIARLLVHAGRHGEAVACLEEAVKKGLLIQYDLLQLGAAWHELREQRRFAELIAGLGLPA